MKEESEIWICFSPFCELSISDIKYVEGLRGRVSAFLDIVQGDKETQELTDDEFLSDPAAADRCSSISWRESLIRAAEGHGGKEKISRHRYFLG